MVGDLFAPFALEQNSRKVKGGVGKVREAQTGIRTIISCSIKTTET